MGLFIPTRIGGCLALTGHRFYYPRRCTTSTADAANGANPTTTNTDDQNAPIAGNGPHARPVSGFFVGSVNCTGRASKRHDQASGRLTHMTLCRSKGVT
jgi:hypothetical protein